MSFADTFKALSDPTRREILNLLKQEKLTAGEIVAHFDTTGATISHYELNLSVFEEVLAWIQDLMEEKHEED